MSDHQLIKVIKGIFIFVSFFFMGLSIPDENLVTLTYLRNIGIHPHLFQFLFIVSAFANLIIALRGVKWNAIWFATWVTYSMASFMAYLYGAAIPLLTISAYLLVSFFLTMDVLEDAGLFAYIGNRLWNKEALSQL